MGSYSCNCMGSNVLTSLNSIFLIIKILQIFFIISCHKYCGIQMRFFHLLRAFLHVFWLRQTLLPAAAEPSPNTSWCTTAAETFRVSRDSSGCPAPSRVSTRPRPGPMTSTQRGSWAWLWIRLGTRSPPGCRASWETSLIPTWRNSRTERPSSAPTTRSLRTHNNHHVEKNYWCLSWDNLCPNVSQEVSYKERCLWFEMPEVDL